MNALSYNRNWKTRPAPVAAIALILAAAALAVGILLNLALAPSAHAQSNTGICDRTQQVQDAILDAIGGNIACGDVTPDHLAADITNLDLSGDPDNQIGALKAGDFAGLSGLTTLNLSDNLISDIPREAFSDLSSLELLNLNNNRMPSFPSWAFSDLSSLEELNLNNNGFTVIYSGDFSGLSGLIYLDLSSNEIATLEPGAFSGLSGLTSLNLKDNELTELLDGVFLGLTGLATLDLSGNEIAALAPGDFSGLSALELLRLENNRLTALPDSVFAGLSNLDILYLETNPKDSPVPLKVTVSLVRVLDDRFDRFKVRVSTGAPFSMTVPIVTANGDVEGGKSAFTINAGELESETFRVSVNPSATDVPTVAIGTLPDLPKFSQSAGGLPKHSGYELVQPDGAQPLRVNGGICERTPKVRDAILSRLGGAIDCGDVTPDHLAAITGLYVTSLVKDSDRISELKAGDFSGLSGLTTLSLKGNRLTKDGFPSGVFSELTALQNLDLTLNHLEVLPSSEISGLSNLETLDLRHNEIAHLDTEAFSGLSKLRKLDLKSNQLTELPDGVFSGLTGLKFLHLDHNPKDDPVNLQVMVSLVQVSDGEFKVQAHTGAPFYIGLTVTVENGCILIGGADKICDNSTTIVIQQGDVESQSIRKVNNPGAPAPTISISGLPDLPSWEGTSHTGYKLVKLVRPGTPQVTRTRSDAPMPLGLDVTWAAAADGTVTGYEAEYRGGNHDNWTDYYRIIPAGETSLKLQYLVPGAEYQVRVRAITSGSATNPWATGAGRTNRPPQPGGWGLSSMSVPVGVWYRDWSTQTRYFSDPDGDTLSLFEFSDNDALVTSWVGDNGYSLNLYALNPGQATIIYGVRDGYGGEAQRVVTYHARQSAVRRVAESPKGFHAGSPVTGNPTHLNYEISSHALDGEAAAVFDIDPGTGQITLKPGRTLDYETKASYTGRVQYTVNGGAAAVGLTIEVEDIPAPAQPLPPMVTAVAGYPDALNLEWTAPNGYGAPITDYNLRYRLRGAVEWIEPPFDGVGLSIVLHGLTDAANHEAQVQAVSTEGVSEWSDSGYIGAPPPEPPDPPTPPDPPLDPEPDPDIGPEELERDGDGSNSPPFFKGPEARHVDENAAAGTAVGDPVTATDNEDDTLTYSISGAGEFTIDPGTGQIKVAEGASFNRAAAPSYVVTVGVTDSKNSSGGGDTSADATTQVTIRVTNAANPPVAPSITFNGPDSPILTRGPFTVTATFSEEPGPYHLATQNLAPPLIGETSGKVVTFTDAQPNKGRWGSWPYPVRIRIQWRGLDEKWEAMYDPDPPRVHQITGPAGIQDDAFTVHIQLTENVVDFTADDLAVVNGEATALRPAGQWAYEADIRPTANGTLTVDIPEGAFLDVSGNGNTAARRYSVQVDLSPPTPGAPRILRSHLNPATMLDVIWPASQHEDGPVITGYNVQYQAHGETEWTDHDHSSSSSVTTIQGLNENTVYRARVQARNAHGESGWSDPGEGTTDWVYPPAFSFDLTNTTYIYTVGEYIHRLWLGYIVNPPSGVQDKVTYWVEPDSLPKGLYTQAKCCGLGLFLAGTPEEPQETTELVYVARISSDAELEFRMRVRIRIEDPVSDPAPWPRKPGHDVEGLDLYPQSHIGGMTHHGNTLYLAGRMGSRISACDLTTKQCQTRTSLGGGWNGYDGAWGLWAEDATTLWVADLGNHRLNAYDVNTWQITGGFVLAPDNGDPRGIWSDGETMWVVNHGGASSRVFAYDMTSSPVGARLPGREFDLPSNHDEPEGAWGDGATMWIVNDAAGGWGEGKLMAYDLSSNPVGARLPGYDIALDSYINENPRGIASDGTTMWVTNWEGWNSSRLFAYHPTVGPGAVMEGLLSPTACAGPDISAAPDETVTLQGTCSANPHGQWWQLVHRWRQAAGPAVTLSDLTVGAPSFTVPAGEIPGTELVFELTVTLASGATDTDTVTVTVSGPQAAPSHSAPARGNRAPVFDAAAYDFSISEDVSAGEPVGSVAASDPDGDALTYYLSGPDAGSFAIDATGQITTVDGVTYDYETQSTYLLAVEASDGMGGDAAVSVTVTLTDANDPPAFDEGYSAVRNVPENSPAGVTVGLPLTATDQDGDALIYSLSGADAGSFDIESATGQLLTRAGVSYDYEEKAAYSVMVYALDRGGLLASIPVTVTLTDVDETPPVNWPPEFHEGESATRQVAENSPAGTRVGAPVTAYDRNGDGLVYWGTEGADGTAFHLGQDGQLTTIEGVTYDYETKSTYQFMVIVGEADTYEGYLTGIAVTVTLADVAEGEASGQSHDEPANRAPSFAANIATALSVAENSVAGTSVGSPITATDPDGDTLTYTLSGADAASFDIDTATGQLRTREGVTYDYEVQASYALTVTAWDGNGGSASIDVTVSLTDVDETPAEPIAVTACFTDLGSLTVGADYTGTWDDADCRAHHQDSPARYVHFTLPEATTVEISLSAGALFVSRGTPQNGWGTPPGGAYEDRQRIRQDNGKLVHAGSNSATLTLVAGETYTVEASGPSGGGTFTLRIAPR